MKYILTAKDRRDIERARAMHKHCDSYGVGMCETNDLLRILDAAFPKKPAPRRRKGSR